jgi:hypothetical protein
MRMMSGLSQIAYLDSHELTKLRGLFETIIAERGLALSSQVAENLAARIIKLYMDGITEESELRQAMAS